MHTTSPPGWDAAALSDALKRLKDLGHTFASLADLAGISRSQMSRWFSGGHRPGYDATRALATGLLTAHPTDEYRVIVHDLCAAAGYPGIAVDLGATHRTGEVVSPYSGQVRQIVYSLEKRAGDAGLPPEEARGMIERALENAERQAEMMFDAELRRRETAGE